MVQSKRVLAVLLFGLALLVGAVGGTVWQIVNDAASDCIAPAGAPAAGEVIALTQGRFRLGQGLCLGINVQAYFAEARAVAKVGTVRRLRTVQLFFDAQATPAVLTLDIDATGAAAPSRWAGWVWAPVALRPATNADSADGKAWRTLLTHDLPATTRAVHIGLADKPATGDAPLPRADAVTAGAATLEVYNLWLTLAGAAGLVLLAGGTVAACWDTGLLRDRVPTSAADKPPFSLGRVQMGFWLVLSIAGFLAIWLITGIRSGVITPGLLTLLGISGLTGLAARMIDVANPASALAQSANFLLDIISEGTGSARSVAVHRIQMLAWTAILGMIFVWTLISSFAIADFDSNLLLLAGISSGTYIGFKFPEKQD